MKKVVVVEGLISGGKTTLARELGHALGETTLILTEPDEKDNANPYLADFYADMPRYAFTMQCHLLSLRYRMHLNAQWYAMQGQGHAVMDRSYFGDTAFARLQLKTGTMTQREFDTYVTLYKNMTASVLHPTVCVRVQVTPEVAQKRIQRRIGREPGRACESVVALDYLRTLDREIDYMVDTLRQQGVIILDLPWNDDRDTKASRSSVIGDLARRIEEATPVDIFLNDHRRTI